MSNITGDGESFSSGINTGEDDEVHQHHEQQQLHHHLFDGPEAAGANSDVSTSRLPPPPAVKKKRNLPGTPDPAAEVIALSPKTLMATNRFICEICHKGFQRDQNLQLHRRGHNLPWKLKQRTSTVIQKKVYICPEPACVHHNPSRALGDLTGIKKHYCRKHGEKKWKCDKCSKKYAVQSDWKAHSRICGTREYKCDCGTIFSRRDSFITHRAFCDALAQDNSKLNQPLMAAMASSLQGQAPKLKMVVDTDATSIGLSEFRLGDMKSPPFSQQPLDMAETPRTIPSSSLQFSESGPMGFDGHRDVNMARMVAGAAHMSATALLQKAAQMGATTSGNNIMYRGFTSVMAGPDRVSSTNPYGPMKAHGPFDHLTPPGEQSQLAGINRGGTPNRFYTGVIAPVAGMLMNGDDGFSKNAEHRGREPGEGNVMTVDFLGVGGDKRSLDEQKQAMAYGSVGRQQRLEGLHPFQQQTAHGPAMEKPMWDV
ncbi:zinc finger protein GAI-ASSOCIATED FACTOR 1-like [Phoenix dactylifera]|uniref:Protein EARLY HEADING DATE 2 n=1 Tax=Phoenix dactylifera TaxID=42345 RepID=A0A8B7C1X8_PHODC|nr:zinc finger protein GAI-ASSOCIATED FACTOR 1-like [Phoenix dactylifera]